MNVRLAAIGECSFDIDVAAHVDTRLNAEFVRVREELLHACVEVVEQAGVKLAIPTRQFVSPGTPPDAADAPAPATAKAPAKP
jgi:MscS family membrane protein